MARQSVFPKKGTDCRVALLLAMTKCGSLYYTLASSPPAPRRRLQLQAVHFPACGGGVGQLFHQGGGVSGLDGLAVGADIFLQLLQGAAQGLGIHGEQLGPQGHVQGGHAGAAPKESPSKP